MLYCYRIAVVRVIDGDTIKANVDLGFGVWISDCLRLMGIDAPEVYGRSREAGQRAKAGLIQLLEEQDAVFAKTAKDERGKYGRMLATLFGPDGLNLNEQLVARGHAKRVAAFSERWD